LVASTFVEIFEAAGRYQLNLGAEADHAIYQELGTSRHRAQPFIRPTLDMLAALVPRTLQAEANARGGG
jgi:HK97 gp10 family phage protein